VAGLDRGRMGTTSHCTDRPGCECKRVALGEASWPVQFGFQRSLSKTVISSRYSGFCLPLTPEGAGGGTGGGEATNHFIPLKIAGTHGQARERKGH
jgi:hypothetical protein